LIDEGQWSELLLSRLKLIGQPAGGTLISDTAFGREKSLLAA